MGTVTKYRHLDVGDRVRVGKGNPLDATPPEGSIGTVMQFNTIGQPYVVFDQPGPSPMYLLSVNVELLDH